EVVDLLFGEIDDLAALLIERDLAIAFDDHRGGDTFAGGAAAEHLHHAAEHAGELDLGFLVGLHVSANRVRGQQPRQQRQRCDRPSTGHTFSSAGDLDCTPARSQVISSSGGAQTRTRRENPRRSKRKPPTAGPLSRPTPHAMLYSPYATPNEGT